MVAIKYYAPTDVVLLLLKFCTELPNAVPEAVAVAAKPPHVMALGLIASLVDLKWSKSRDFYLITLAIWDRLLSLAC